MNHPLKTIGDVVVIPTAIFNWFIALNLPDLVALAALVYTVLRIFELLYGWFKGRHK